MKVAFQAHSRMRVSLHYCIVLILLLSSGCVQDASIRDGMVRQARMLTLSKTVTLQVSALDSKLTARTLALAQVHRPLLDEMISLLEVTPAILQMPLTREQLVTLSTTVVQPEIEHESWDGSTYVLTAKVIIAPPQIVEILGRLQGDMHAVQVVEHVRERIDTALREIPLTREAFASANNPLDALRFEQAYLIQIHVLSAMQWFTKGLGHVNARNYIDAVIAFSAVIELLPQDAEAYSQRAVAYHAMRQHQQALEDVSRAIELRPGEAQYFVSRGLVYEDLNESQLAFENFTRAVELDPQCVSAYIGRGRVSEAMRNYQQALADFSAALEMAPQKQVAYYNRGTVYSKVGDYERAVADFSRALELDPKDAAALNNRGALYGMLDDHEQAVQDFTAVIALKPQEAKGYFNRAAALEKLGRYAQAIQDYSAVLELDPGRHEVYYNRGKAHFESGQYAEAIGDLTRAVEIQPDLAEAHYELASAYKMLGKLQEAVPHYRVAAQSGVKVLIHYAQERLKEAGFDPGPLDGVLGPHTEAAIRKYQKANGFPVTGRFDDATIRGLLIESLSTTSR